MSPAVTECLEHARQCEWYAAGPTTKRTANSFFGGAEQWTKRAQEKELETRASPRRLPRKSLGPSLPKDTKCSVLQICSLYVLLRHDEGRSP